MITRRDPIILIPALKEHSLQDMANMLLTVHDELVFEVARPTAELTAQVVKHVMESAALPVFQSSPPLTVVVSQGASWAESH